MSGHSKWSTIKRKKGAADAARGKVFTKAAREIIISARQGGGDPAANSRLRLAIIKAKEVNMPNDNIKRAIDKAVGGGEGSNLEEVTYEAYAQAGVAVIIECMTDNKNRTLPEVRNVMSKRGGNMAEKGAVSYLFNSRGLIVFNGPTEDQVMEVALDFDVEDVATSVDGTVEVTIAVDGFEALKESFDKAGIKYESAEVTMIPSMEIPIEDKEVAEKILSIIDALDELDDVQNVYHNAQFSDALMDQLAE